MANAPNLRVKMSADVADLKQGIALIRGDLAKLKQQAAQAPATGDWLAGLKSIRAQLAGIVSVYAAMRAVRWYADASDQASKLTGRLKLVTSTQEQFNKAYQGTFKLAQDSQADWQSIVGLFAQLSQTTGQSQDRILNLTKIIGQAFRVSGASAEETANGLRQLQQAMAGGTLRAEEFNTIIETSPRIVQALADHFGISFGQVRKYVNDGKVTSQAFMEALEESAGKIQSDFDKLPKTVGGAVQQVRNALIAMVGDTNTATGASNDLAEGISSVAKTLESPGIKQGFQSFIGLLVTAAEKAIVLAAKVGDVASALREYFGELDKKTSVALRNQRDELEGKLFAAQRRSGNGLSDANDPIAKLLGLSSGKDGEIADLKSRIAKIDSILDARAKAAAQPAPAASPSPSISPSAPPGAGKPAKLVAESNALMRDSVDRAIAELDRLYKAGEVGIQNYFATRTQLQQQAIDLDIEQARNELAVTKDKGQRLKLEEQIAILQRDRAEVTARNAHEEKAASDEMIDKLGEVQAKLAELDGNTAKAARIRIYAEFHELFKALEANSDQTGKKMVQNLVDRLVSKAQADAIANRVSTITSGLSTQEQSISAQMDAGTLGMAEGERRLQEIRQKTLEQLREQRVLQAEVLRGMSVDSPDFAAAEQGLAAIDANIANTTASMNKFKQGVEDVAVSSLTQFFDDLIDGTKSFKDAFIDMVRSFLAGVAKMIAQEVALAAIRAALRAWGGGSANGNAFDGGGQVALARGGVIANGMLQAFANGGAFTNGVYTRPTYFAFGKGGQFGVMGEAGPEAVMPLTRGPGGRLGVDAHGAGGGGKRTRVIVVDDERKARDYMTPGHEEAVLVHIGNNAGKIKEMLGGG